jgi:extradiol dioxygenase family protein
MDANRILAIDHVRLEAGEVHEQAILDFYGELIGLERRELPTETTFDDTVIAFRGHQQRTPALFIRLSDEPPPPRMRRAAVIEIESLHTCAERLDERKVAYHWSRGWFPYDRRLIAIDPAGNRIELVTSHPM